MKPMLQGYAGLKSRKRRDLVNISQRKCQDLSRTIKRLIPIPDGWLPIIAYRALDTPVSRAVRLEALSPYIPELVRDDALSQTCVQAWGSIRFFGDLPLDCSTFKEYRTEFLSDCLDRNSKQIRLLQKTRYLSEDVCLINEVLELHYRIKPTVLPSSLVESNCRSNIFDRQLAVDEKALSEYLLIATSSDRASFDPVFATQTLQLPGLLVPIDFILLILISALHLEIPTARIYSLDYQTYGQFYTDNSSRICASFLSDKEVLMWAESDGYLKFRSVVKLSS